jgi:hypothetical protein
MLLNGPVVVMDISDDSMSDTMSKVAFSSASSRINTFPALRCSRNAIKMFNQDVQSSCTIKMLNQDVCTIKMSDQHICFIKTLKFIIGDYSGDKRHQGSFTKTLIIIPRITLTVLKQYDCLCMICCFS